MNKSEFFVQYPDAGDGGAAGGAAPGAAPAGGAPGAAPGGAPAAPPAMSPTEARTFLTDYVHDAQFLNSVPDEKVLPWATRVKAKLDGQAATFPANWRQQIAGENVEWLKTLERFQSPRAMYESYAAIRSKLASGELRAMTPFPAQGTDPEKTEWRKAQGLPATAEAYEFKPAKGLKITEADQPGIEAFKKYAFENHLPPAAVSAALNFALQDRERRRVAIEEHDAQHRTTAEDALRAEWGGGYRENINRVSALLDGAPKGVKDLLDGARLADGKLLGDHPDVLRWLVEVARGLNPSGVLLPGEGGTQAQSIETEIKAIEQLMRDNRTAYNKDEKKQARLRDLYAARDKVASRQRAA